MSELIQAIRGMNDVLPNVAGLWRYVEKTLINCLSLYGYEEIRVPLLENTKLFKRTIGEMTDIVSKEMYTFTDLNGENISLRPEGTAGCVRACLEHSILYRDQPKLWYLGPMFRHEKPQKGRYRQFHQFGVEAFGILGIGIELELLIICKRLWKLLKVENIVELEINTLGELSERQTYRNILVEYLRKHFDKLDEDSQKRLEKNPLRILDSKNPKMQTIIDNAPKLYDTLGAESKDLFSKLCKGLEELEVPYRINHKLVRGLDYYNNFVFEWTTQKLGSQSTICAGGRYDKLVELLGGPSIPAVGFAIGIERLLMLIENNSAIQLPNNAPDYYIIAAGEEAITSGLLMAELLHNENIKVILNTTGANFKNQFKKADKSGAKFALILGEDEIKNKTISIKDLRGNAGQIIIPQNELLNYARTNSNMDN